MVEIVIVSAGSIIGGLIRWQIENIFFVNILGCFILGFINNLNISKKFKLFFCFSLCGSLTTFSTWILELFKLLRKELYLFLFFNIFYFLIFGFIAVYLGDYTSKKLFGANSK